VAPGWLDAQTRIEGTLARSLDRGDIIQDHASGHGKGGREPDVSMFALQGEDPADPVLGRLVARGLHDELTGSAYAIVEGVDGRTHHVRFADIEMTGDAIARAIVEARAYEDVAGRKRLSLGHAIRPDPGGTGCGERRDLARPAAFSPREPATSGGGFGAEVRMRWTAASIHLAGEDWRAAKGSGSVFARDLINTLRRRELDAAAAKLLDETGFGAPPLG